MSLTQLLQGGPLAICSTNSGQRNTHCHGYAECNNKITNFISDNLLTNIAKDPTGIYKKTTKTNNKQQYYARKRKIDIKIHIPYSS
jgi:hypothetical protein